MPTVTIRLVAVVLTASAGLPTAPIPHALHQAADTLVGHARGAGLGEAPAEDIRDARLGEAPAVDGSGRRAPSPDLPPDVERWRPLVAMHFPDDWIDWGLRIIACESGGDPAAKNPHSSATGLFQFLRSTWNWVSEETGAPRFREGGPLQPWWNVRNAAWLLDNGGTSHWECRAPT